MNEQVKPPKKINAESLRSQDAIHDDSTELSIPHDQPIPTDNLETGVTQGEKQGVGRWCRCCCRGDTEDNAVNGRRRRPFRGNPEAIGWCLDVLGRTLAIIAIGAFMMPALLELATEAAGCTLDEPCDKTIYGIKPSSLLTTVHTIVSVGSAPLMPLMGAIVDYTSHRRIIGRLVSLSFCLLLFAQIFVSEKTWFVIAIVQIVMFFLFLFQTVTAYSYLPELTNQEQVLNDFTRNFTVVSFSSIVIFIAGIIGGTVGSGITDNVAVAHVAVGAAFGICSICLFLAWGLLFKKRPPLMELPEGMSIWMAGFCKLYHTSIKIHKDYRALKWFFVAIACCDGAIQSLMTIMITFLTEQLEFSSQDIGVGVLILLLANVPGGFMSGLCSRYFNPIRSSMVAVCIFIIVTATAAAVLKGPGQQTQAYFFIFGWGIGTGWKWTSDRMLVCAVIPQGQNAEYMGIYLFFSMILTWMPPLIFTSLNEAGVSERIGLATLNGFFLAGFVSYCVMGGYRDALEGAQGILSTPVSAYHPERETQLDASSENPA